MFDRIIEPSSQECHKLEMSKPGERLVLLLSQPSCQLKILQKIDGKILKAMGNYYMKVMNLLSCPSFQAEKQKFDFRGLLQQQQLMRI